MKLRVEMNMAHIAVAAKREKHTSVVKRLFVRTIIENRPTSTKYAQYMPLLYARPSQRAHKVTKSLYSKPKEMGESQRPLRGAAVEW